MILNDKQAEIAVYNLKQIVECLKKINKAKAFLKDIHVGTGAYSKWIRKKHNPRKPSIDKVCKKLNVEYDVFVSKKIKVKFNIETSFED